MRFDLIRCSLALCILAFGACSEDPEPAEESASAPLTYAEPQPLDVPAAEEEPEAEAEEETEPEEEVAEAEEPTEEAAEPATETQALEVPPTAHPAANVARQATANGQLRSIRNLPRVQLPINRQPNHLPIVNRGAQPEAQPQVR